MTETPLNRLAVMAIIAGTLTGVLVAAGNHLIVLTEQWIYGANHLIVLDPGSNVSPGRLALTLICVGIVTSWIWYLLERFGRPAVSVPGAMHGNPMPLFETSLSAFTQVVSVAAGAPVGRENAPRLMGGMVASRLATALSIDAGARRILVASAAGAGLAASFHLPLAGALFALELLLVEMSTRTVVTTMLTSATAVATTALFVEPHPIYHTVPLNEHPRTLLAAILVGAVSGISGHWFGILARKAAASRPRDANILWEMPFVFTLCAIAAYFLPGVSANGRWAAETVFTAGLPIGILVLLGIARGVIILACFRAGTVGGTLTPAFALGALTGGVIGIICQPLFPDVPVAAFALLGAGAFLSTTMAAPMFGMIAAVEFTDLPAQGYLAMFVAVITAALAVRVWGLIVNKDQRQLPFTYAAWTSEASVKP
ncbi:MULTISPECIES: chloride channel protein [unclassified Corynebacterium]|uniref:chloride channel protein n=1 Tax=unclassified Corynebacterium TaxID=2624378 RepID=UPI003525C308